MAASFAAYASQFINRQPEASMSSSQPMFFSFTTDSSSHHAAQRHADDDDDDLDDADYFPHLSGGDEGDPGDPYLRLDEDESQPTRPLMQRSRSSSLSGSSTSSSPHGGWLAHQATTGFGARTRPRSPILRSPSPTTLPPPQTLSNSPYQQPRSLSLVNSLTDSLLPRDGHSRPVDVFSLPDPRTPNRFREKYNDSIWTTMWLFGLTTCFISSFLILFLAHKPTNTPSRILPYYTLLHTVPLLTITTFIAAVLSYANVWLMRLFARPVMIVTAICVPLMLGICALVGFVGSFMWDEGEYEQETWGETVGLRIFSLLPLFLSLYAMIRFYRLSQFDLPRTLARINASAALLNLSTDILVNNPLLLVLSPSLLLVALLGSIPFLTLIFRLSLVGYSSNNEWHLRSWTPWAIFGAVGVWLWSWGVVRGIMRVSVAGVVGGWYFGWKFPGDRDFEAGSSDDEENDEREREEEEQLTPPPELLLPQAQLWGNLQLPSSLNPNAILTQANTHTFHAALYRATHASLGTIALAALILAAIRGLTLSIIFLDKLPVYISEAWGWLTRVVLGGSGGVGGGLGLIIREMEGGVVGTVLRGLYSGLSILGVFLRRGFYITLRWLIGWVDGWTRAVSADVLVYAGMMGDGFWRSASRAGGLQAQVMTPGGDKGVGKGKGKGKGRRGQQQQQRFEPAPDKVLFNRVSHPSIPTLTLVPLTLTLPFALTTYLFVAHALGAPNYAFGAAVLAGGVTWLVGGFCKGVVGDVADTLWMCYCVDRDRGMSPASYRQMRQQSNFSGRKEKRGKGWERVWEVFEYNPSKPIHPTPGPSGSRGRTSVPQPPEQPNQPTQRPSQYQPQAQTSHSRQPSSTQQQPPRAPLGLSSRQFSPPSSPLAHGAFAAAAPSTLPMEPEDIEIELSPSMMQMQREADQRIERERERERVLTSTHSRTHSLSKTGMNMNTDYREEGPSYVASSSRLESPPGSGRLSESGIGFGVGSGGMSSGRFGQSGIGVGSVGIGFGCRRGSGTVVDRGIPMSPPSRRLVVEDEDDGDDGDDMDPFKTEEPDVRGYDVEPATGISGHSRSGSRGASGSASGSRRSLKDQGGDGDEFGEEGGPGSQVFPGSGLF
ncbi:hypothetical protein K435DRAFT_844705 [Dendrothele bispora CBS 962.96]|uniref:Uncharacterized protein n=1 Tax=Dendrothele bispora (strain CBS 962.96) TaxID=1314807 RepID=A0A4S8KZL4_DENBC|nr:hypothetical protein K435DRAFT_844705 [Dendrothele bispora CBS 962.96]